MLRSTIGILATLALFAASHSAPTQAWTPKQIVYQGAPQYQAVDLNTVAGLKLGRPLGTADVDPALQRLADTGLFANIRYTIDNRSLTFTLTPQPDSVMLPALYSNFVMFQPAELTSLVHIRVPLFSGRIPASGNLQQSVQDALAAILIDKGFAGATVESLPTADQAHAMSFSITNPTVLIRTLQVEGVSPVAQAKVAKVESAIANSEYSRDSEEAARKRLEETFEDLAFLDIAVDLPTRSAPTVTGG